MIKRKIRYMFIIGCFMCSLGLHAAAAQENGETPTVVQLTEFDLELAETVQTTAAEAWVKHNLNNPSIEYRPDMQAYIVNEIPVYALNADIGEFYPFNTTKIEFKDENIYVEHFKQLLQQVRIHKIKKIVYWANSEARLKIAAYILVR